MNFKAHVFDAYGTLFQINSNLKDLSVEQEKFSGPIQELWRTRQVEYTWLNSLMGKWESFGDLTVAALDFALETYGQSGDSTFRQKLLNIYAQPSLFPDVRDFISKLKSGGMEVAILSNGVAEKLMESVQLTALQDSVDEIFSASAVRRYKPSPEVYQMVIDYYTCEPEEISFYSSNAWDIAGAKSFGFNTTWVNRSNKVFERLGPLPDHQVSSLAEV